MTEEKLTDWEKLQILATYIELRKIFLNTVIARQALGQPPRKTTD